MTGEELLAYSSIRDLFALVGRRCNLISGLVGSDKQQFDVLSAVLAKVRDTEAHQRDVAVGELALAKGVVSYLRDTLRNAGASPTRTLLSRAVDQFTNPELGYGMNRSTWAL